MIDQAGLSEVLKEAGYDDEGVVAVAVVSGNGTIVRQALGTVADGRPMSTNMRVYGASLTKQFVGASIARLVADGRLDPDQPIATWIANLPAWSDQVSVRHLLHHTAGLPDEDPLIERMRELGLEHRTSQAMLRAVATFPELESAPGETHRYANVGYVMLARIVETVTGQAFDEHLDQSVFKPLGMTRSLLWAGPERHPEGANPLDPQVPTPHSIGDGGMWTTADDLTLWIAAMNADAFGVRQLMMTTTTLNNGDPSSYAWGIGVSQNNGTTICTHGGGWPGSVSRMAWSPERNSGFIAFTVTGGERLDSLASALRDLISAQ